MRRRRACSTVSPPTPESNTPMVITLLSSTWIAVCRITTALADHCSTASRAAILMRSMLFEVDRLCKRFGGIVALSDVTFHVEEGELLGLIGPNGAGKATLFECLSGVLRSEEHTSEL